MSSNSRVEWAIANAFLASALLPFVSPFPIAGRDAQLLGLVCAVIACAFAAVTRRTSVLADGRSALLLAVGWLYLFHVRWDVSTLDGEWLRRCGAILLCIPVYWAARAWYHAFDYRVVLGVVALYATVAAGQWAAPGVVNLALRSVLGELRFSSDTGRGLTSLAAEPSHLAIVAALLLWLPRLLPDSVAHLPRWCRWGGSAVSVALALASGAMLGVALLAGMCGVELLELAWRRRLRPIATRVVLGALAAAAFVIIASQASSERRVVAGIRAAVREPTALVRDLSLQARIVGVVLTVQTLASNPLGTGRMDIDMETAERGFASPFFRIVGLDAQQLEALYDITLVFGFTELGRGIQRLGLLFFVVVAVLLGQVRGFAGATAVQLWLLATIGQNSLFTSTIWLAMGLSVAVAAKKHAPHCAAAQTKGLLPETVPC